MIDWAHAWPAVTAAFLASLVEFVEALTIVLAVGAVRGWRHAMVGTAGGVVFLTVLVLVFGPTLHLIPITALQIGVGVLLCLFGMRWLRKAILRSAGVIGLHDEEAIYKKQTSKLSALGSGEPAKLDMIAAATTFKAVTLEGLEVVFIVIATGAIGRNGQAGSMVVPAAMGAAVAGLVVIALGLVIHKPLSRVPENTLKFAVGVMLSAFGVFWVGEGLRFQWPGEDLSLVALAIGFVSVALIGVALAKRAASAPTKAVEPEAAL
jgi:uncharacterized membrane protein